MDESSILYILVNNIFASFLIVLAIAGWGMAEQTKTVYSPFTGKLDYITKIDSSTIVPGAGISVSCTGGACTLAASGSAASNLEVLANNVQISSPTGAISVNGTSNGIGVNAAAIGSTATLTFSMLPGNTNYIQNPATGTWVNTQHGIVTSTLTITSLAANECVQTSAGGFLTTTGAPCGSGGGGSSSYLTKFVLVNSSNVPCEFTVNTAGAIVSSVAASIDPGIIARNSIVKQDPDFGTWTITANTTCTIVTSPGGSVYEAVSDLLLNDANNKTWVISVNTTGSMVTL